MRNRTESNPWLTMTPARVLNLAEKVFEAEMNHQKVTRSEIDEAVLGVYGQAVDHLAAFLLSDDAKRLLGPCDARVPASWLFSAFEQWASVRGFSTITQTFFGRSLADSPLVLPGRNRAGKFYVATPTLHKAWSGSVPAAFGGEATMKFELVNFSVAVSSPAHCEIAIRAARGGTSFNVWALSHVSVFDAAEVFPWAKRKPRKLGKGPLWRAYVVPFALPEEDRAALDDIGVRAIMAQDLFQGEVK